MNLTAKRMIAGICAFACVFVSTACTPSGKQQKVDDNKTQLYIANYALGMGSRWLDEYVKSFQAKYADTHFEEGKTGVEVIAANDSIFTSTDIRRSIKKDNFNLYFTEGVDYYDFVFGLDGNLLYDITDIVTENIPDEDKTIEDKINDSLQSYFKVDGKYYGLPHYRSYRGIVYDKDLFNGLDTNIDENVRNKALYIKQDGSIGGFKTDNDLSYGPNGKTGIIDNVDYSLDDGLPATYEEFFNWCEQIKDKTVTPICFTGEYKNAYTTHLLNALFADAQGTDSANAFYNVPDDGSAVSVKTVSGFTADGKPIISDTDLSRSNYTDKLKMSGMYYSLDFLYKLVLNNNMTTNSKGSQSHAEAHREFLESRFFSNKNSIAMMIEGTWWEEESNKLFAEMEENYGEAASRAERNFGFLPLPKPTADMLGSQTMFDGNQSICMVNGNCDEVHAKLAKLFIQHISTDSNLQLFNTITGIGRDYIYELTKGQYDGLSSFAKDVYNLSKTGKNIAYGFATSKKNYVWDMEHSISNIYNSKVDEIVWSYPISAFLDLHPVNAKDYFVGLNIGA